MTTSDSFTGTTIAGKYMIKERLGAGGMGVVYRARHTETGGDVAVKVLHGTAALDDDAIKRFRLEAQNAAQLRHANTIRIMDFGVDAGVFYLVMEYLEGRSLADVLVDEGPLPWQRVAHILRQILKSLWEAHEHRRQIVHRDIKPANLHLIDMPGDPDHVKVLDFGIARSLVGTGAGTRGAIGTPYYMAPELWRGLPVDGRTDLYALGCVAFKMLSGSPPFRPPPSASDILLPLLSMHCNDPPPAVVDCAPRVPQPIAEWVDGLLHKDMNQRPVSARVALEALDRAVAEATAAPPVEDAAGDAAHAATLSRDVPLAAIAPTLTQGGATPPHLEVAATPTPRPSTAAARPRRPTPRPPKRGVAAGTVIGLIVAGAVVLAALIALVFIGGTSPRAYRTFDGTDTLGPQVSAFTARLSAQDHVDQHGNPHTSAAAVITQDRANYHHWGKRDVEDEVDATKGTAQELESLQGLLTAVIPEDMEQTILHGEPLVRVTIHTNGLAVEVVGE